MLYNLGNPYKLTLKKYLFIKYILSFISFIVISIRDKNILLAILLLVVFYILPDIIIYMYKRNENFKIINDISNIVQSMILSLSCNMPLFKSLEVAKNCIVYNRFKIEYSNFISNYMLFNFNMPKAVEEFKIKFDTYELNIFLSMLIQADKEGNVLENLEALNDSNEIIFYKYLKYKSASKMFMVTIATVVSLINSFTIVLYPIIIQVTSNLGDIFK